MFHHKTARPFLNMMQQAKKNTAVVDVQSLRRNICLFIVTSAAHLRLCTGACSQVVPRHYKYR